MAKQLTRPRNDLLANLLSLVSNRRLESLLEPVPLKTQQVIYEPGDRVRHAVFPERGVISIVNVMQDAKAIEVGTIGHEGMSGVAAVWGVDFVPYRCIVQVGGSALRLKSDDLLKEAHAEARIQRLLSRYYVAFTSQIMQSAACAGLHSVEQRCCRWLLAMDDRADSDQFSLSHEFLALMLGTRRTSVSLSMKKLQDRSLIKYHRGTITIVDRAGLETRACECYRVVADTFRRIMGSRVG